MYLLLIFLTKLGTITGILTPSPCEIDYFASFATAVMDGSKMLSVFWAPFSDEMGYK